MARHPRYTTFAPGELEARLRELAPKGTPLPNMSSPSTSSGTHTGTFLKDHCCEVTFPDRITGTCRYERGGPRWHLFYYSYGSEGFPLPRQAWTYPLSNYIPSIEAKARELAEAAYLAAIQHERKEYFCRASEPANGSRKKQPQRYRMKAALAKELAGKYALCQRSGSQLFVVGSIRDTIEEANADWREKGDPKLVVGCCNRLDRCWELPRFNLLYAVCDPRPEQTPKEETTA